MIVVLPSVWRPSSPWSYDSCVYLCIEAVLLVVRYYCPYTCLESVVTIVVLTSA